LSIRLASRPSGSTPDQKRKKRVATPVVDMLAALQASLGQKKARKAA